jgi:hypothetical protein
MSRGRYRGVVVDLVDPYFTREVKNAGGFRTSSPGSNLAICWMRRHPGRWALVGENNIGLTKQLLKYCPDIQALEYRGSRTIDGIARTYARLPHPKGEPLADALRRRPFSRPSGRALNLPEITRDEFNWSPEELKEACRVAREHLFPVSP